MNPEALLRQWWGISGKVSLVPLDGGLINRTWLVEHAGSRAVFQWVNPIFPPESTEDVDAVCRWLADNDVQAPRLLPSLDGRVAVPDAGGTLRLMTFIDGRTASAAHLREAAAALGRFHSVLADCPHRFLHNRDIHNTPQHLKFLAMAISDHVGHDFLEQVAALAEQVTSLIAGVLPQVPMPERIVHGDPKLENFLMTARGPVLIDLDTVGRHSLFGEIGDALRSWCVDGGHFSMRRYREFLPAYLGSVTVPLSEEERGMIGVAHIAIGLELTARFLRDTLEESYFRWDRSKYRRAAEHNIQRARDQLAWVMEAEVRREETVTLWFQR